MSGEWANSWEAWPGGASTACSKRRSAHKWTPHQVALSRRASAQVRQVMQAQASSRPGQPLAAGREEAAQQAAAAQLLKASPTSSPPYCPAELHATASAVPRGAGAPAPSRVRLAMPNRASAAPMWIRRFSAW